MILMFLNKNKIEQIINCGSFLPNNFSNFFSYLNLELEDTINQEIIQKMEEAYQYIKASPSKNIFVHCAYGASLNGEVIAYYLMKDKLKTFQEAYDYAILKRSCIKLNKGFIEQLQSIKLKA